MQLQPFYTPWYNNATLVLKPGDILHSSAFFFNLLKTAAALPNIASIFHHLKTPSSSKTVFPNTSLIHRFSFLWMFMRKCFWTFQGWTACVEGLCVFSRHEGSIDVWGTKERYQRELCEQRMAKISVIHRAVQVCFGFSFWEDPVVFSFLCLILSIWHPCELSREFFIPPLFFLSSLFPFSRKFLCNRGRVGRE